MTTTDFKIFNDFADPIFLVNQRGEIVYQNKASEKFFGVLKNFSKIKHYFSIDTTACILDSRFDTSIIDILLQSKENFYSICSYQISSDEYHDLAVSAAKFKNYTYIRFQDITQELTIRNQAEQYTKLQRKYDRLLEASRKIEKLKESAQQHALQTALINRVFAKIRKSEDISELMISVVSEIHELLGSYKSYFVVPSGKQFVIKLVNSQDYNSDLEKILTLDKSACDSFNAQKIYSSACLKESLDDEKTLRKGTQRVIIPISGEKKTIGAIITLTVQTSVVKANLELLQTIAEQLTGAVIRTLLTDNIKKQNKKLKKTLKELEETQLQLINSEKMASLGQLVAGVAHEINTPLGSINSNNEMLTRIINSDKVVENLEIIKSLNEIDSEAVKRISTIVKSLKKFVRLDEAELQPADINKELDLTLQLVNHELKNKVTVIKDYAELPMVNCYVNMLNQVFMNLIINACHSIKTTGKIFITTKVENDMLTVSVKDTGCGIPEKNKNKIFNVGFTTKGIGAGTGLGLAISQKIISKHKGTITFTSKEGEGTEFIVKIPCK